MLLYLSLFCKSDPEFEYQLKQMVSIKSLFNKAIQIDNLFEIILNLMNIDEEKYYTKGSISPVILKKVYSILEDINHELHQIPKDDKTTATNLMMINKAGLFDKKEESGGTSYEYLSHSPIWSSGGAAPINDDLQILLEDITRGLNSLKESSDPEITEDLYKEVYDYIVNNPTITLL